MEERIRQLEKKVADLETFKRGANQASITPLSADTLDKTRFKQVLFGTKSVDFGSIVAQGNTSTTIPVNGARPGDVAVIGFASGHLSNDAIRYTAYVSSADIVTVIAHNDDNDASNEPDGGIMTVAVFKL